MKLITESAGKAKENVELKKENVYLKGFVDPNTKNDTNNSQNKENNNSNNNPNSKSNELEKLKDIISNFVQKTEFIVNPNKKKNLSNLTNNIKKILSQDLEKFDLQTIEKHFKDLTDLFKDGEILKNNGTLNKNGNKISEMPKMLENIDLNDEEIKNQIRKFNEKAAEFNSKNKLNLK